MHQQLYDNRLKTVLNWSSGKDAALAYHYLLQSEAHVVTQLLTTVSEEHERIVMHGVKQTLLDAQAQRMNLPLKKIYLPAAPDDNLYKQAMHDALAAFKQQDISTAAYGDIFLEDLKVYREQQLAQVGFNAIFPLWKRDTRNLVNELEQTGIEAMIVCVNEQFLGKEYLGKRIDINFLNSLPANVDPCGEHGEFHTFVYNAPYFSAPIVVQPKEIVYKQYNPAVNDKEQWHTSFYFLDLDLA